MRNELLRHFLWESKSFNSLTFFTFYISWILGIAHARNVIRFQIFLKLHKKVGFGWEFCQIANFNSKRFNAQPPYQGPRAIAATATPILSWCTYTNPLRCHDNTPRRLGAIRPNGPNENTKSLQSNIKVYMRHSTFVYYPGWFGVRQFIRGTNVVAFAVNYHSHSAFVRAA